MIQPEVIPDLTAELHRLEGLRDSLLVIAVVCTAICIAAAFYLFRVIRMIREIDKER